jgi:uncharacterized protein YgbK (DUF1537 family)
VTTRFRLLADDLTGALDSAARFVPLTGPLPVVWRDTDVPEGAAIDSGTRDLAEDAAYSRIKRFAPLLQGADIAFKKIDSLLRGHVAMELAVWKPMLTWMPSWPKARRLPGASCGSALVASQARSPAIDRSHAPTCLRRCLH